MKAPLRAIVLKLLGRGAGTQPGEFRPDRARWVQRGVYVVFAVIAGRAAVLHLFPSKASSLQHLADAQYAHEIELAPARGAIFDRQGEALAISIKRPSIAINPRIFAPTASESLRLARILKIPPSRIKKLKARHTYFAWLARHLDHKVAEEATTLGLDGLTIINEPARFYPAGPSAAHLLGFTGLENHGLAGLEKQFDKDLRGQGRKVMARRDARGRFILDEALDAAPELAGNSVHLTIDRVLQEIAEDELEAGVRRSGGHHGFVIVSDPHTGRVLALANYPSFDPNNPGLGSVANTINHALVDSFEPGSVTKPFIVTSALEKHKTVPDEIHDCEKGTLKIGRDRIHDAHPADKLTTAETIIHSSNICSFKIASKLGKEATYDAIHGFGLAGGTLGLGFPGEVSGRLAPWQSWKQIRFATVSFGQGFLVTGLELVSAMGAIANGGRLMRPTLVERLVSADGLVLSSTPPTYVRDAATPQAARTMREILARVVTDPHGTAKKAVTEHFTTAGKTGTAQKVDPGVKGYAKGKYIGSFIGFAPVADPHLVIYVMIDEPNEKSYYGGLSAAPVFSAITERALRYLNVAPDKPAVDEPGKASGVGVAVSGKDASTNTRKL